MKNKKGFTLVETLAVIILLGVILMIAVPSINNVVDRNNKRRLEEAAEMFVVLAKEKLETDTSIEYPNAVNTCGVGSSQPCDFVVLTLDSINVQQLKNIVDKSVSLGKSTTSPQRDSKVVFSYESNKWKPVFVVLYDTKGTAAYEKYSASSTIMSDKDNNITYDIYKNCASTGGYCYE